MPQQPEFESLASEVRALAARVARLEELLGQAPGSVAPSPPSPPADQDTPPADYSALIPILGRGLLGLAGAYLLRALTEAGTLPHPAGIAAGLLYAIFWLVWAARTPAARRAETAVHALTSVVVLAPLLWEATLRFHAVSTWTAGGVLLVFTLCGLGISWRKHILIPATIATVAGLGTSGALLMATYDVLPFTLVILAIAAAVEASACLEHWLSERWLAAGVADLSVLLATWLVTREGGLPPAYAPFSHSALLAVLVALLGIYLSSTIVRTLLRGFTFTAFETAQCAAALAITVGGCLRLSAEDPRIAPAIGILALVCAAACYAVSFARLSVESRNFYTYSTFGILLALAGARILFSGDAASAIWSALAIACYWAGGRWARVTLEVHASIYLLLGLFGSGALAQAAAALLGNAGMERAAVMAGAMVVCGICLALGKLAPGEAPRPVLLRVACLTWLASGLAAGLLTGGYHALFGANATPAFCATLRTAVLSGASLMVVWAGYSKLLYPLMVLAAYRLLLQDLHQDLKAAAVLSLLIYGATLMALPVVKRARG